MAIETRRYAHASEFLAETEDLLLHEEAKNSIILGITARIASDNNTNWFDRDRPPYFVNFLRNDEIVFSALRTPPHQLIVTAYRELTDQEYQDIANVLVNDHSDTPGILGVSDISRSLGSAISNKSGKQAKWDRGDGLYELTQVIPTDGIPGSLRQADLEDRKILLEWSRAFEIEGFGHTIPGSDERLLARLGNRLIYIWEIEGKPSSMAMKVRTTKNTASIGIVYTPKELRRKGYASALVASLSQHLLDAGFTSCVLLTDLANPTSNKIYQNVGYESVCELAEIDFE